MAEEFEESEVVFNVNDEGGDGGRDFQLSSKEFTRKKLKKKQNSTVPVSIPEKVSWLRYVDPDLDNDDGGEMVPPHVIVGRRVAGKMMAFSVCTGNGRTLKGRDLSQVRNSILKLTGFLET
ncbi:protein S40-1-like [Salvia miltiorrhiza]|uniref:protein S40-1-like n=1 Tax=Salvia miltiorrhiza TaxID=226208 RepID=UPI0025AC7225|nr:protein S40-1-like [Salvia miltiorrhiza]